MAVDPAHPPLMHAEDWLRDRGFTTNDSRVMQASKRTLPTMNDSHHQMSETAMYEPIPRAVDRTNSATKRRVSERVKNRAHNLRRRAQRKVIDAVPFERKRPMEAPVTHVWAPDVLGEVCTAQYAALPHRDTAEGQLIGHHLAAIIGLMALCRPVDSNGHGGHHTPLCGCDLS